jgi:hypothetical protein
MIGFVKINEVNPAMINGPHDIGRAFGFKFYRVQILIREVKARRNWSLIRKIAG